MLPLGGSEKPHVMFLKISWYGSRSSFLASILYLQTVPYYHPRLISDISNIMLPAFASPHQLK